MPALRLVWLCVRLGLLWLRPWPVVAALACGLGVLCTLAAAARWG